MIDVDTAGSPGWMLARLHAKLLARRARYQALFDRYDGKLVIGSEMKGTSEAFERFWKVSHTNFAEMIVRAVSSRLSVAAIRTAAADDELGDSAAWRLFRSSGLDVALDDAIRTMLIAGDAFLMAGMVDGKPRVTAEDPRDVVTVHDPIDQAKTLYGAKFFHHDEEKRNYAYLHVPGRVYVAYTPSPSGKIAFNRRWSWDEDRGGVDGLETGLDLAGIVRLRSPEGVGEFERHTPLLDRIDHMVLQGMVIATMQAFKQRAFKAPKGAMPDVDPDTGERIDWDSLLTSSPDKIWKLPEAVEIWESGNVDLTPIWTGTDKYVQQLSAVTFTPLSMFSPEGQNQSAEGASLAREGLVAKSDKHTKRLGYGVADVMHLLFLLAGDPERADRGEIVVDWSPVERYGLSEKWNAAVQAKGAGVPWRTLMAKIGQFTPGEIGRMETERADDAMMMQLVTAAQSSGVVANASGDTDPVG